MLNVGIIIGSTRPGRNTEAVAKWVYDHVKHREDVNYELIDIKDYNLPLLDEAVPPMYGQYSHEHTKKWSTKISSMDAFIFVSPEYNHGISGALKNAIDYLYKEWNNKAAAFVSFGSANGVRAVESLRLVMAELQIADVRGQVSFSLHSDFENYSVFKPGPQHEASLGPMVDQLIQWGEALKSLREEKLRPPVEMRREQPDENRSNATH